MRNPLVLKIDLSDYMPIIKIIEYHSSLGNTIISLFLLSLGQKFAIPLYFLHNSQQIKSWNLSDIIDVTVIFTFKVTIWFFF